MHELARERYRDASSGASHSRSGRVPAWEQGFVICALLLLSGAIVPLARSESGAISDSGPGDPVMQALLSVVYAVTLGLALFHWDEMGRVAGSGKLVWALVGMAVASALWAENPYLTLIRGSGLVGTTIFGMYLAGRYSVGEQVRLLAWAFGLATAASLLVGLTLPSYGLWGGIEGTAWRGVYDNKNMFGRAMALSTIVYVLIWTSRDGRRWRDSPRLLLLVGASAILLVLSNSMTAALSALAALLAIHLARLLRHRHPVALPVAIVLMVLGAYLAAWLVGEIEPLFEALDRDLTLTGRTNLWPVLLEMISERPWLGYGYASFWSLDDGSISYVQRAATWKAVSAHNGFLDLSLDLGLIGLTIFVLGFVGTLLRALTWVRQRRPVDGIWPLAFLGFFLMYNYTESVLLLHTINWALYTAVVFSLGTRPAAKFELASRLAHATDHDVRRSPATASRVPVASNSNPASQQRHR